MDQMLFSEQYTSNRERELSSQVFELEEKLDFTEKALYALLTATEKMHLSHLDSPVPELSNELWDNWKVVDIDNLRYWFFQRKNEEARLLRSTKRRKHRRNLRRLNHE